MRKYLFFIFCVVFTIGIFNTKKIFANDINKTVRVGLETNFKDKSELKINNVDINLLFDGKVGGEMLSSSGFSIVLNNSFYLKSKISYDNYYEAFHQSNMLNYSNNTLNAKPAYLNNTFYILIGGTSAENGLTPLKSLYPTAETYKANNIIEVKGETTFLTDDQKSFSLKGVSDFSTIGGKKYRGSLGFVTNNSKLTAVNVLLVEEYLYGVLASEMPSSWHEEALKAQCVSARSYVYTSIGNHEKQGYNLCDTTHCQVYKGIAGETEKTNKIVDSTKGLVAYYDNKPINGVFFSSSGGITDNSENAWVSEVPYLRSVLDTHETTPKVWTRTFTMPELTTLLEKSKAGIGQATGISITKMSNERVLEITIHGSSGVKVLKGESIRTFFSGTKDGALLSRYFRINEPISQITTTPVSTQQNASGTSVFVQGDSNSFESYLDKSYMLNEENSTIIDKDITAISEEGLKTYSSNSTNTIVSTNNNVIQTVSGKNFSGTITLNGKGYGHGVGLSQYGAKGMAEAGYNFTQILKHYYSGIEIK